jgi:hypothetical protein
MSGAASPQLNEDDREGCHAAVEQQPAPPREPLGPTMSDVKLADLRDVAVSCRDNSMRFEGFRQNALVSSLGGRIMSLSSSSTTTRITSGSCATTEILTSPRLNGMSR